jgi:hypothetical protein
MVEYVTGDMSETQVAMRIGYALRGRLSSLCSQIQLNITHSIRMIDDLPSYAINAMLEYSREMHRHDHAKSEIDKAYKDVRAALIKYGEVALREAKIHERRMMHDLTGPWENRYPDGNGEDKAADESH